MVVWSEYEDYISEYVMNNDKVLYQIGRGDSAQLYNFIPMGFDIETTTQYRKDDKGKVIEHFSNMYVWQWQFDYITFMGRTWEELETLIKCIYKYIAINHMQTICFIHNMAFEFSFVAKELKARGINTSIFARKKRKPMKWILDDRIVFLDSMLLTHLPLSKLAKAYCKTQKLVGELDYTKIRNSITPLSEEHEIPYCINDVIILSEYASFYEREYLQNNFMPMTQTMIANLEVKHSISELKCNNKVWFLMQKLYPKSKQQYDYFMLFFTGAYTHGMLRNLFIKLENGLSFDVTSEYPYVMMNCYFPMGKFHRLYDLTKVDSLLNTQCCLCDVVLKNIKSKHGVTILSKNKIIEVKRGIYDNGRLYEADSCRAFLTEIDIETLKLHYDFEPTYNFVIYAKRGYLPDYIRLAVAKLYMYKDSLKGVEGMEREYMTKKEALNAQYGSFATKLTFEEILFDENWKTKPKEIDFDTVWHSKNKLPQWAIYVTSHARALVLDAVSRIKPNDYWYTDTDSIKCSNKPYILNMFNELNKHIRLNNEKWISDLKLKERYPNVDFAKMGTFDREKDLKYFKSLGSKRYIYTTMDEVEHQTIAGLPKTAYIKYCENEKKDFYDDFSEDGINLSEMQAEKLTAFYEDKPKDFYVTDYLGNTELVHTESYVSLIPITFNLKVTPELQALYRRLQSVKENK